MINPISQIYNFSSEIAMASKEVLSEFLETLVWRYEKRYKTKVVGMYCTILAENGKPVGNIYAHDLMATPLFAQDMLTAQICEFTETKEILIKTTLRKPSGTFYMNLRLFTEKNQKNYIDNPKPNVPINVATQKLSKSLQETLENIDMEFFASHYSEGYRAKFE